MRFAEVCDLGDQVLALGTLRVTGTGSGIEIEVPLAIVASFRDGLVTSLKDYGDKDRALAAVGLPA
jgi:ketosteroid isomerase-like protein